MFPRTIHRKRPVMANTVENVQLCILCIKPLRHTSNGLRGNQPYRSEFQSLAGVIRVQDPNLTSNMHL